MRRSLTRGIAALLLSWVAGCGSRVVWEPATVVAAAESGGGTGTVTAPPSVEAAPSVARSAEPRTSARAEAPTPSPSPEVDMGPQHNDGRVKITLSATCATPGTPMVATIQVKPKSGLGLTVAYADYRNHGAMAVGETPTGRYEWRFVVAPDAPVGKAVVLVSATDGDAGPHGGTADRPFLVVTRLEDCSG